MNRKRKISEEMNKLTALVLVLMLVTATAIVFDGSITGNVAIENSGITYSVPAVHEVNDINDLKILNEGFYLVSNGYVFYMESADTYIPLYIKVNDVAQ